MSKPITIGVPTYKRPREVFKLIGKLLAEGVSEFAEILVIDDGPTEEIRRILEPVRSDIMFIQHDLNQGYARTFIELFARCRTEYLMITADDDRVLPVGALEVAEFVSSERPDFVSTVSLRKGRVHRGKMVQAPLKASEVRPASNHAPGLVYRTEAVRPHLGYLETRLKQGCHVTFMYPQVVIAYVLVLGGGRCFWHPAAPVEEGARLPSNLRDESGDLYFSVPGRFKEHVAFLDLFEDLSHRDLPAPGRNAANALRSLHGQQVYQLLTSGLATSETEMMPSWIAGSVFYPMKHPITTIRYLFRWIQDRREHHRQLANAEGELIRQDQ